MIYRVFRNFQAVIWINHSEDSLKFDKIKNQIPILNQININIVCHVLALELPQVSTYNIISIRQ